MKLKFDALQTEYENIEHLQFRFETITSESDILSSEDTSRFLDFLCQLPQGVLAWHPSLKETVATSSNIGSVHLRQGNLTAGLLLRSFFDDALEHQYERLEALARLCGGIVESPSRYPAWTPRMDSPLLKMLEDVFEKAYGRAHVKAIHAGLEPGIFHRIRPGLDIIAFGPLIEYPHSPDERVHMESVDSFYGVLCEILLSRA
jgi:dipeptidase D